MSVHVSSRAKRHSKSRLADRLVLFCLADNANEDGYCWPSVGTISRDANLSERQTRQSLANLEASGDIAYIAGRGRGHVSVYVVLSGLPDDERAHAQARLETVAEDLAAVFQSRRERRIKGANSAPIFRKNGAGSAPFIQQKVQTVQQKVQTVQIKGADEIGVLGVDTPDQLLNRHRSVKDPPPPPRTPKAGGGGGGEEISLPPRTPKAGGGGGGEEISLPPPAPHASRTALRAAGVRSPSALARLSAVPPEVIAEIAGQIGDDAKSRAAILVTRLDDWLAHPEEPAAPPVAPSVVAVRRSDISHAMHAPASARQLWLAKFSDAAPADRPGIVAEFRRQYPEPPHPEPPHPEPPRGGES